MSDNHTYNETMRIIADKDAEIAKLKVRLELCDKAYKYTSSLCNVQESKAKDETIAKLKELMLEAAELLERRYEEYDMVDKLCEAAK